MGVCKCLIWTLYISKEFAKHFLCVCVFQFDATGRESSATFYAAPTDPYLNSTRYVHFSSMRQHKKQTNFSSQATRAQPPTNYKKLFIMFLNIIKRVLMLAVAVHRYGDGDCFWGSFVISLAAYKLLVTIAVSTIVANSRWKIRARAGRGLHHLSVAYYSHESANFVYYLLNCLGQPDDHCCC